MCEEFEIWDLVCPNACRVNIFPCLINQQKQSDKKEGLQGRKIQKLSYFFNNALQNLLSPSGKTHTFSKDQTHRLCHCLIYLTKKLKLEAKLAFNLFPCPKGAGNGEEKGGRTPRDKLV
jgi:hypothetical protein